MPDRLTTCPYCGFEAQGVEEEIAHMQATHRDVITERMRAAGFIRDPGSGEWIDRLADAEGR